MASASWASWRCDAPCADALNAESSFATLSTAAQVQPLALSRRQHPSVWARGAGPEMRVSRLLGGVAAAALVASGPLRGSCRGEPDLQGCQWQVRARRQALSHHGRVDPLLPGRPGAVGGQAAAAPRHGAERRRGKEPRRHRHSRLARETARTVQRPQAPCLRPRAVPRARLGPQVYVFWNWHQAQPGPADFSTPSRQLAKFLQLAKEAGLVVMLRVGPYGCGEWNGKVAPRHGPAAAGPGTNGAELPAASSLVGAKWRLSPAWGPLAAPVHGLLRARKQARPTRVLATRSCC